jgi:error-prone DNA polymerase
LRTATSFSFLNGASLPEDLIYHAAQKDLPAIAVVDTNGVYGAPRFHSAAKKAGIRALVGAELKLADTQSGLREASSSRDVRLTLLVETRAGYKNLCRLLTAGALAHPKGEARYTWKLIEQYNEGLRCLTGGDEGPVADVHDAEAALHKISGIFQGRTHV